MTGIDIFDFETGLPKLGAPFIRLLQKLHQCPVVLSVQDHDLLTYVTGPT
jgi:hypothetical protein